MANITKGTKNINKEDAIKMLKGVIKALKKDTKTKTITGLFIFYNGYKSEVSIYEGSV